MVLFFVYLLIEVYMTKLRHYYNSNNIKILCLITSLKIIETFQRVLNLKINRYLKPHYFISDVNI